MILRKLAVHTRGEAGAEAVRLGLTAPRSGPAAPKMGEPADASARLRS